LVLLAGLFLAGLGIFYFKNSGVGSDKVEILGTVAEGQNSGQEIIVEISGAVENPGVYKLPTDSRIEDLLIAGGGLSADADRDWVQRNINRAAKLTDGQKVFVPATVNGTAPLRQGFEGQGEVVNTSLININTADLKTLDLLPGIGPVYAQNIVEHRPYSTVQELVSRGAIPQNVYEKIKEKITVY